MQSASPRIIKLTKCSIVFGVIMLVYITIYEDEENAPRKRLANKISDFNTVDINSNLRQEELDLPTDWDIPMTDDIQIKLEKRRRVFKEIPQYHDTNLKRATTRMPSVILIGARKCGTGGIARFLGNHPLIKLPKKHLETFFFNRDFQFGLDYYKNLFPPLNDKEIGIEKTPSYFDCSDRNIAKRIKDNAPKAKILLIICDPIARALSDYTHQKLGKFPKVRRIESIDEYMERYLPKVTRNLKRSNKYVGLELCSNDYAATILTSGLYYYHIQEWTKLFNRTQFMMIDGDKYLDDPGAILEKVQEFIGVPKLLWKEDFVKHPETGFYCYRELTESMLDTESKTINTTSLKCLPKEKGRSRNGIRTLSDEIKSTLKEFYAPYNKMFCDIIGKPFSRDLNICNSPHR